MGNVYVWVANSGTFASPDNWGAIAGAHAPPPIAGDTAEFNANSGFIAGGGTVASLQFDAGAGPWTISGALVSDTLNDSANVSVAGTLTLGSVANLGTVAALSVAGRLAADTATVNLGGTFSVRGGAIARVAAINESAGSADIEVQTGASLTVLAVSPGTFVPSGLVVIGRADVSGGTLTDGQGSTAIGSSSGATVTLSAGGQGVSGGTNIGINGGDTGSLLVSGSGSRWSDVAVPGTNGAVSGVLNVGGAGFGSSTLNGTGHVTITAGAVLSTAGAATLAETTGSAGDVTISQGSSWSAGKGFVVGQSGVGSLSVLSGGRVSSGGTPYDFVGLGAGGFGQISVDGTGSVLQDVAQLIIGNSGTGLVRATNGGSIATPGVLAIGQLGGSSGTLNVASQAVVSAGSSVIVANTDGAAGLLSIGAGGTVQLTAAVADFGLSAGLNGASTTLSAASGAISVSGAGALLDAGANSIGIGVLGRGTLSVTMGGTLRSSGAASGTDFVAGQGMAANGSALIDGVGSALLTTGASDIGNQGTGSVIVSNAALWRNQGGAVTVGDTAIGQLQVQSGGTVLATDLLVGRLSGSTGTVTVAGTGSQLLASGGLSLGGSTFAAGGAATFAATGGGRATFASGQIFSGGRLVVDNASLVEIGGTTSTATGSVVIDAGGSLAGAGLISGGVTVQGTLDAENGTLGIVGSAGGAGFYRVGNGATLQFLSGVLPSGGTVGFAGAGGLQVFNGSGLATNIVNFDATDEIDLVGQTATGSSFANGTLTIFGTGGAVASLAFTGPAAPTSFKVTNMVGPGGSPEVQVIACFAAGTRIMTRRGEVPIEKLDVGDQVMCMGGRRGWSRVLWIGRRRLDIDGHPRPRAVAPVRVRAGALGPDQPTRDLWLSPDHAVLIDEVLVPIRHLINGHGVTQPNNVSGVTYYHVEVERHDVLIADGQPAETWLDTGSRSCFESGPVVDAFPVFDAELGDPVSVAKSCRPRVIGGPQLVALRRRLSAAASEMEKRSDAAERAGRPPRPSP